MVTEQSATVEFYREAIAVLLTEMGHETDEERIDALQGQIARLSSRMADSSFANIVNRTAQLTALVAEIRRITAGAAAGGGAAGWVNQLTAIADVAGRVVARVGPIPPKRGIRPPPKQP